MKPDHLMALFCLLAILAIGACVGWLAARWYYKPTPIVEKAAAPVWHDDGTLTAMRDPAGKVELPETSAPPGGVLIRTVEVTVKPKPVQIIENGITTDNSSGVECPSATVRLDLRQYDDGQRFGIISDGEVLDAIDVPRSSIYTYHATKYVAGIEVAGDRKTVKVGRSIGPVDLGPSLSEEAGQWQAGVWAMARF